MNFFLTFRLVLDVSYESSMIMSESREKIAVDGACSEVNFILIKTSDFLKKFF